MKLCKCKMGRCEEAKKGCEDVKMEGWKRSTKLRALSLGVQCQRPSLSLSLSSCAYALLAPYAIVDTLLGIIVFVRR